MVPDKEYQLYCSRELLFEEIEEAPEHDYIVERNMGLLLGMGGRENMQIVMRVAQEEEDPQAKQSFIKGFVEMAVELDIYKNFDAARVDTDAGTVELALLNSHQAGQLLDRRAYHRKYYRDIFTGKIPIENNNHRRYRARR